MESTILHKTSIQKQYQQYLIKLSYDSDLVNIIIEKDNTIYESNFNLQSLHQYQLFISSLSTQEIIKFIIELIDMNKIEIKEENMNLKFILISTLSNHSNIELNLLKKNIISNEMIVKLEGFHKIKDKHKIKLKSCNLKNITSIHCHNDCITSVSTFPSGNIISTSDDKSIIIYDILFNILQKIQNAHDDYILYVEIKDENNFITCSSDKNIKSWNKNNNEFKINKILKMLMMKE